MKFEIHVTVYLQTPTLTQVSCNAYWMVEADNLLQAAQAAAKLESGMTVAAVNINRIVTKEIDR